MYESCTWYEIANAGGGGYSGILSDLWGDLYIQANTIDNCGYFFAPPARMSQDATNLSVSYEDIIDPLDTKTVDLGLSSKNVAQGDGGQGDERRDRQTAGLCRVKDRSEMKIAERRRPATTVMPAKMKAGASYTKDTFVTPFAHELDGSVKLALDGREQDQDVAGNPSIVWSFFSSVELSTGDEFIQQLS